MGSLIDMLSYVLIIVCCLYAGNSLGSNLKSTFWPERVSRYGEYYLFILLGASLIIALILGPTISNNFWDISYGDLINTSLVFTIALYQFTRKDTEEKNKEKEKEYQNILYELEMGYGPLFTMFKTIEYEEKRLLDEYQKRIWIIFFHDIHGSFLKNFIPNGKKRYFLLSQNTFWVMNPDMEFQLNLLII
ncbi:MAG: hypothetical protein ACTSQY_09950 [Candidatus Odinarchaeia archaeon]